MSQTPLKAQILRDSNVVSKLSEKAKEVYSLELKATVNRGAFYSFSGRAAKTK